MKAGLEMFMSKEPWFMNEGYEMTEKASEALGIIA